MQWTALIAVVLGGGIGAGLRFLVYRLLCNFIKGETFYFLATLSVNVLGCLLLGFIMGFFSTRNELVPKELILFLGTGLCGGFTTFSTFGMEGIALIEKGELGLFALYMALSLGLGLMMGFVGLLLGHSL